MSKREREGFDWRFLIVPVVFLVVGALAVGLNILHDDKTVAQIANSLTIDNGDEKINWGRYPTYEQDLQNGTVTISKPGTYHLTGNLFDGGVELDIVNTEVKLILDNVTIINPEGPAIYCGEGEDVVIELVGENYLEDGATYADKYDEKVNGAIYVNADLTFMGDGGLTVVGKKADGIVSKDDLKIVSGAFDVRANDDGIRGTDSLYIKGGELRISAKKDALKSTKAENSKKGFVLVEGGNFQIDVSGKGIEAVNAALVRGGNLEISANEGVEAKTVAIDGGEINILAMDDGLNAKSDTNAECLVLISGGKIYIDASGDGIDANGRAIVAGGQLMIDGPSSLKHGALDADDGVLIKGGEMITTDVSEMTAKMLDIKNIKIPTVRLTWQAAVAAGTMVSVRNINNEAMIEYVPAKRFTELTISSARFELGETYNIYVGDELVETATLTSMLTEF